MTDGRDVVELNRRNFVSMVKLLMEMIRFPFFYPSGDIGLTAVAGQRTPEALVQARRDLPHAPRGRLLCGHGAAGWAPRLNDRQHEAIDHFISLSSSSRSMCRKLTRCRDAHTSSPLSSLLLSTDRQETASFFVTCIHTMKMHIAMRYHE